MHLGASGAVTQLCHPLCHPAVSSPWRLPRRVIGQSESNVGRLFRGPGVVLMVSDAFVAAGAVASPSSSLAAGSDLGATSALSSSCADGRSRRRVTVIPESNAPSVPLLAWVLAIEKIAIAQVAVVAPSCYVVQSVLCVAA